jgi:glyoxylase-like metal-dependent hydrolase (beta-lactamase superfamily II)
MKLGDVEIDVIPAGFFKLDGGAMFGIVPKQAWEKVFPCDELNRIRLGLNVLLIRSAGRNVLVDSGIGDKHDAKWGAMYDVQGPALLDGLKVRGLAPADIHGVILSHLHFDHAGGATTKDGRPAFPNATYYVQEGQWAEALEANPRTKGSYRPADFLPIEKQTKFLKGNADIAPGIRVVHTGGHVKHHQSVFIEGRGKTAVFWGDLIPTSRHLKPAWVMGYDLYPADVAALKQGYLDRAIREEWIHVFEHDPDVPIARVRDGYVVEPLVVLETA